MEILEQLLQHESLRSFFENSRREDTEISIAIAESIHANGIEALQNPAILETSLRTAGLEEMVILQIRLLLMTPGYHQLLQCNPQTWQKDLDCFTTNAQKMAGLSRKTILSLTADLLVALGHPTVETVETMGAFDGGGRAFAVPAYLYESQLSEIHSKIKEKQSLSEQERKELEELRAIGIPEAKYYLAKYVMEPDSEKAAALLQEAAADGCVGAQMALGDYYYGISNGRSWTKAYEYYSGYGAAALNQEQRVAMTNIVNHKRYNQRVLWMGAVFLAAILLMIIISPANSLYGTNAVLRTMLFLCNVLLCGAAAIHYRSYPYDFLNWLIPSMFGIWWIYLFCWLLV